MTRFEIGGRVERKEERESVGATVVGLDAGSEGTMYLIAYDEGGEGWWPEESLQAPPEGG